MGGWPRGKMKNSGAHINWRFSRQYKLYVLSLSGNVITSFSPDPDPGFGIRKVAWHPSGMFLVVGGWDDKVSGFVRTSQTFPILLHRFTSWTASVGLQ